MPEVKSETEISLNKAFNVPEEDWAEATRIVQARPDSFYLKKNSNLSHDFCYMDNTLYAIDDVKLGSGGCVRKAQNRQGKIFAFKVGAYDSEAQILERLGQLRAQKDNAVLMTLHAGESLHELYLKHRDRQD